MSSIIHRDERQDEIGTLVALGVGLGAAAVAYAYARRLTQYPVAVRPGDDAPPRTSRTQVGPQTVVGRTVTINKPRAELYAFWSDFSNFSRFMLGISEVTLEGDVARWQIDAPLGRKVRMETRLTTRTENEELAWESTGDSQVQATGKVLFRDAPAGRGTELEAVLSYVPPLGEVGRLIGKMFQTDPLIQGRSELRRFKMLMETGEIATNKNHEAQG